MSRSLSTYLWLLDFSSRLLAECLGQYNDSDTVLMEEEWRGVLGFSDYEISNLGNLRSLKFGLVRPVRQHRHPNGYLLTGIYRDNKKTTVRVHRLVAQAFMPNPDNKPQVNHIDGKKSNNVVANLEWATNGENIRHGMKLYGKQYYASMLGRRGALSPYSKPIAQYKDNKIVAKYAAIREAARENDWDHQNIIDNLKGRTSHAYGYQWRYI